MLFYAVGDPTGIRTRVTAVKGRCLRPLDHGAWWSGWRDSNPRPLAPKASALAKLRHAPSDDGHCSVARAGKQAFFPNLPGAAGSGLGGATHRVLSDGAVRRSEPPHNFPEIRNRPLTELGGPNYPVVFGRCDWIKR